MEAAGRLRNLLHRDMSIGNVMFSDVEGIIRGILADWDHAAEVLTSKGTVYQNFRTVSLGHTSLSFSCLT